MVDISNIQQAQIDIANQVRPTPCWPSHFLSKITGGQVFLKLENFNLTGSYKERGALNRLLKLTPEERKRGVVTASAGNHAQAVAYHASHLGIRSTIFMPLNTPLTKLMRTQRFGAKTELIGECYDDAYEAAIAFSKEHGAVYIHAYNDPDIIAGQGTVGIEIAEQVPHLDAVVIPVGGGGLAAGISLAMKSLKPSVFLWGVEPAVLPSMAKAVEANKPVILPKANTIAEGIAVRKVGELTLEICRQYMDEFFTVTDEDISKAIVSLVEEQHILAEGAGAAAVAWLMQQNTGNLQDKTVVALVTGGNADINLVARLIERGLVESGRLARLQVKISDRPGSLASLLAKIAEQSANVLKVHHDRAFAEACWNEVWVELVLETRGESHAAQILRCLQEDGVKAVLVGLSR